MLALGRGFISFNKLKELMDLPEDVVFMSVDREFDGFTFHIVSENEIEGKLCKVKEDTHLRRFIIDKDIDDLRKQGENHDS